ncbi:violaxanthin de-epoxidase-like protein [Actinidia rufa]|uniref:Violaxanthin de-epoxidase-like protein n=1 Tax=Actinidia rufa TaxID=165716 RepID=A0A7J0EL21_9ERIC|nr:violaxanthin de-epoxidase-like protein [Actinidia rufa]
MRVCRENYGDTYSVEHNLEPWCGFQRADATFSDESDYSHQRSIQVLQGRVFVDFQNRRYGCGTGSPPGKMSGAPAWVTIEVKTGLEEPDTVRRKTDSEM